MSDVIRLQGGITEYEDKNAIGLSVIDRRTDQTFRNTSPEERALEEFLAQRSVGEIALISVLPPAASKARWHFKLKNRAQGARFFFLCEGRVTA
jgi:hypothetical protein